MRVEQREASMARCRRLKLVSKEMEMKLIAAAIEGPGAIQFLSFLRANPGAAKVLGDTTDRIRTSLTAAYPGQTRVRVIPNADWDKAGFGMVAAINEAMGLKGA